MKNRIPFTVRQLPGIVSFVAAALLCARATHAQTPAPGAAAEDLARDAMSRGLAWLEKQQKPDGSWSNTNYPAMTAIPLWAFARSEHPEKARICAKAADFVANHAKEDGGIYRPASGGRGTGGLSTYNTGLCMVALHAYDRAKYAPLILKAREFMAGSQIQGDSPFEGGFGYERSAPPGRNRGDLSNTGWSLMAMKVTQDLEDTRPAGSEKVDVNWVQALKFVEKLQNKDASDKDQFGGFGYEMGGERGGTEVGKKDGTVKLRGFGSMTYAGLESMIYAQVDRKDPRVQSALQWACRHWSVDENPGMGQDGLFYYYNIMAKSLSLYGADTLAGESGRTIPWKQQLIEKLVKLQKPDGSWVNTSNQFWEGDGTLVTAYSILTLEYALGK